MVYHVGGATLNEGNPRKTFLNFRNSVANVSEKSSKKSNPFCNFYANDFGWFGWVSISFKRENLSIFLQYFKLIILFMYLLGKFYKKRNNIQKRNYYKTKSIVYRYFIKNGKEFAELF